MNTDRTTSMDRWGTLLAVQNDDPNFSSNATREILKYIGIGGGTTIGETSFFTDSVWELYVAKNLLADFTDELAGM